MKKQYRRRRTESSESDNGREEGEMEEQSRSPPSKLRRQSEGDDRPRKNGTRSRAADDDGSRRRDRDRDDADHRRRDGRDPRAAAPERTQPRRDGGTNYGRLAVGGSGSLSYRNGERERETEARERDARNGKRRDTRRSAVATEDEYKYDPRSGRRVLVPARGKEYRQDAVLDRDRERNGRDRERDREKESTREREREKSTRERERESTRDRDRESTRDRDRESTRDRERERESTRDRERKSTRDRDRERDSREREKESSRDRRDRDRNGDSRDERERDSSRRDGGREGSSDFAQDATGGAKKKSTTGIFSYIASTAAATANITNNDNDNSPEGGGDTATDTGSAAAPAPRAVRPNSSALSSILRSDRRTNNRLDREQFDAAQSRLRKLAPEGDEVKDNFSTGCRPDLTGRKDHPFVCNVCPMSFPMATQLSDHLERAHGVFRHPSLITPNKSLSVGLAADVHNA